ncbi:AP-5 complex subunit beta-1 isoform X1 [Brienomyrus brachyistius]|uniref:AP-5 complex subunit beta-1 isoform X1 n=1 Tax=Brienomyrus brachyistius TaxID=42636 RepID=UPI0020B1E1EA|nr:AP-5 complex subunit beta-1 isoform X1 [Brienomyrus brachyistius]XP_048877554.1 AP-5 complex subunit beta-1 isoform X1 [Brienomyrus brachyistius]
MANVIPVSWPRRIPAFLLSPSQFLSSTTSESFLEELLHELRDDRTNESTKIFLLSPLLEYPTVLCPTPAAAEETALELLAIFNQVPHKSFHFKDQLMVAITSVLLCTSCMNSEVARSFLDMVFQMIQDTNDHKNGQQFFSARLIACDCLREIETCFPGFLSQKLETLSLLKQQETTPLHQEYSLLYTLGLKNAIHHLSLQKGVTDAELKRTISGNDAFVWNAFETVLARLPVNLMENIPVLQTSTDNKELKSVVSLLLEESYLLTPVSQAFLLRELIEIVAMMQALSPAMFKSQLLRLFGTKEITLLHATLLMKSTFTDSLFTTEDEIFFLKRLVGMAQHPLVNIQQKLFYVDCILNFPENRPISGNGEESLPVLVTPQLAASLLPTVFNDSKTMLSRLRLLSLVYMEADESDDKGVGYLFRHLMTLYKVVDNNSKREMTVTYFRATFIFLSYFYHNLKFIDNLTNNICELYSRHFYLAPNLINLIDKIQECLEESGWPIQLLKALQRLIVELPLPLMTLTNLKWHLKILSRVSRESQIPPRASLCFLLSVLINSSLCKTGGWKMGNAVLIVCCNSLQHPSLHQVFSELADLLQYLMYNYEDTDIQDHARFYYTLLNNLSQEKLSGVLARGPDVERSAKTCSLSSIMPETDGLSNSLTVHQTKNRILKLTRVQNIRTQKVMQKTKSESHGDCPTTYEGEYVSTGLVSKMILEYHLIHVGDVNALYDKLFSICLHFDLTDSCYEKVSDINIPCLFKSRKPPVVRLALQPRQPYPTHLHVCAVFSTDDGMSWYTQLDDLLVPFSDLFVPLPVPVNWTQESQEQLFDHLWNSMCQDDFSQKASSLFCFDLGGRQISDLVEENFNPYLISKQPDKKCYKVLFYLPPQYHLLLKIVNTEDAGQVHIATDNWELLPFINDYLKTVT